MKITKYGHSSLLVETPSATALFDPGVFSVVPVEAIKNLDHIIITHEHPDHADIDTLSKLLARFPDVTVTAPESFSVKLDEAGVIKQLVTPECVSIFEAPHEHIEPFGPSTPDQIGIHFAGLITHPGDSHSFAETMPVLALPIVAPWGSARRAVELALELRPEVVVPIHDWFLHPKALDWHYDRLNEVLGGEGIRVIGLKTGDSVNLATASLN